MTLSITLSDRPIGACVLAGPLAELDETDFVRLRDLVHERGVVAVRDQSLDEESHVAFARRFGDLQKIFIREATLQIYPELFLVSNIMENGRPIGSVDAGRFWHTDGAYLPVPHRLSMLYAIEVPMRDGVAVGDTLFTGLGPAYDALPVPLAARLEGLRAVHSLLHRYGTKTGNADMAARAAAFPPVSHPLVVRHPVTGRRCLYVSEGYTTAIEGLPPAEGEALLATLCEHVVRPEFVYRHSWRPGDLLIWDNCATLHRATFDYALPQRRLMRRATVSGVSLG